jgi:uncharacterized protein YdhG (YjbR/CyaY superfamily)
MRQSADVDRYLQAVPAERRDVLVNLRALCRETLTSYEECIEYGMPAYKRDGKVEVAFASQKNYISLYGLKEDVVKTHAHLFQGLSIGKGCIRFTKPAKMNFTAIGQLLRATVGSGEAPC